jgi:2'-5' RNA ligase
METGLVKQHSFIASPRPSYGHSPGSSVPDPALSQRSNPTLSQRSGLSPSSDPAATRDPSRRVEYLLVIYPGGDLHEKLLDEQRLFSSDYGLAGNVRNKPHITVAAFQAGEEVEETLIRWIQRICNRQESFDIMLNNYSGFPPHTIYLRVQDPLPFGQLMEQLKAIDDFIRSSGCPPVNLMRRPYLSIAGGLTEQIYNKAMPDYSRRTFNDSFRVEELVLLKRGHSFDTCKTVNIFRLLPGIQTTKDNYV